MPDAIVDSNVVFAYRSKRDQYHEHGTAIVRGMDDGTLPRGHVTNYTLPEILNPILKRAGYEYAVETLDFLNESRGFRIQHLTQEDFTRGTVLFNRERGVEITDSILVAYMERVGIEYIYSFDDDFDRFDGITRLTTADNPFD